MSQELFRREVLEARRGSWLGEISLVQPVRLRVLTIAAVLVALAVLVFVTSGTYTRRSRVIGQLVPAKGLATVMAPVSGVVSRVDAQEGDKVVAGQALAVISVPRATLANGDTQAALEARVRRRLDGLQSSQSARRQLMAAQAVGLGAQLDTARRELAQIETEIATRQEQVRIAEESLQRLRQLRQGQYVSALQSRQQEAAALEQVSQVQALQRQAIGARRVIAQLQQALQELPGQQRASTADFQRDHALLEQEQVEIQARGALAVVAPVAGIVATQLAKPGQAVQSGQPLLSLIPGDGKLEAELLVASRAIGFIEPGDDVLLRYHAYPYQKFGHHRGRVARVSRSALTAGEIAALVGSNQGGEPLYRVTVTLDRQAVTAYGQPEHLKPGMLLDADILGEERRLIEWIFEPLYSLKGRMASL